jgi:predicted nucleotidyltransferase
MTDAGPQNEPVLKRFRAAVAEVYGDRLERVILYGSRARGDHQPDSDYDIAVFIKDPGSFYDESGRLAAITTDILEGTGAVISATPFADGGSVVCLGNVGKGAIRRPGFRRSKKRENIHAGDERGRVQRL